jgi:hypothetical protein
MVRYTYTEFVCHGGAELRPRIRAGRAGHTGRRYTTFSHFDDSRVVRIRYRVIRTYPKRVEATLLLWRHPYLVTRWVTRNLVSPSAYCIYCTTSEPSRVTRLPLLGVSEDSKRSKNCTISWVADLIRFDGADTNALYSADPAGRKVE